MQRHAQQQQWKVWTEQPQMSVVVVVDVHDLQLQIRHRVRGEDRQGHGGNHGLAFALAHGIAAVDGIHHQNHGAKGQRGGCQRPGGMQQVPVMDGHQAEEKRRQASIGQKTEKAEQQG